MLKALLELIKAKTGQGFNSLALLVIAGGGLMLIISGIAAGKDTSASSFHDDSFDKSSVLSARAKSTADASPQTHSLTRSLPTSVRLPNQDISSNLISVGKNDDRTIEVPEGDHHDTAAWYRYSVTPGEVGTSVLIGHYDNFTGPSIFFNLNKVKAGDKIYVDRQDGTTAVFSVYKSALYPKDQFPTMEVYGPSDNAEIRLITCGGNFNQSLGDYNGNTVLFARLIKD